MTEGMRVLAKSAIAKKDGEKYQRKPLVPPPWAFDEVDAFDECKDETSAITIDLPLRTPTMNEWMRMHWRKQRRYCRIVACEIGMRASRIPKAPLARCRITVERFSTQEPDRDGLFGALKSILDALQPVSKRHPYGLGFIANDSTSCVVELLPKHVPGREKRTRITIEPL